MKEEALFHIGQLISNHIAGRMNTEEQAALTSWLEASAGNRALFNQMIDMHYLKRELGVLRELSTTGGYDRIIKSAGMDASRAPARVAHRIHFLKTAWFRYAAILLLMAGVPTFLYLYKQLQQEIANARPTVQPNIHPAGNKAVLTLADGSTIVLDSAANGILASQGNTKILQTNAGSLAYEAAAGNGDILYNMVSTPRGGKYQIVLPDDTRVWLNAASSLRFPTSFTGQKRIVTLTGEGYFEVTDNAAHPFIVQTYKDEINVLGTSFNVCSYRDEPGIKTSLATGKVQINQQILRPGEAYLDGKISKTDIEQDLAWKNGTFNFNRVTLKDAMRQLARWYDVAVDYPASLADKQFGGEMGRDLTLSEVLELLNGTDMHFSLQGRTITVTP